MKGGPAPRTGSPSDLLVVGLGNPGPEFERTRHNVGFDTTIVLADRHGGRLRAEKGLHAQVCEANISGRRVLLATPSTYMNDSGVAVAKLVRRAGLTPEEITDRLIVVHDELDLPPGRVKLKAGGGNAGHNGLKSIEKHLKTPAYLRVRIGIGKPPGRQSGVDYVLRRLGAAERELLAGAVVEAADAIEVVLSDGVEAAMNRINASP
ncbi:MAG: aminoacyl-tRNA hydrolase [Acidimicrobiales bacterium]